MHVNKYTPKNINKDTQTNTFGDSDASKITVLELAPSGQVAKMLKRQIYKKSKHNKGQIHIHNKDTQTNTIGDSVASMILS